MPAPAPTPYDHGYNYTAFEVATPGDPKPGGAMDADFYAIEDAVDSVILALADVRAADGTVMAGSVQPASLAAATLALMGDWNPVGTWAVSTVYAKKDLVRAPTGGGTYVCAVPHTSAVFNTEVAAGKWLVVAPVGYGVTAAITPALSGDVGKVLAVTGADAYTWTSQAFTPVGFRNRIVNGDFQINQRAFVSGASLSAGAYGHDRWKAGASGCTYTFTSVFPSNSILISAGSLKQVIEGTHMEGGSFYLSWSGAALARVNAGSYAASPILTSGLVGGVDVTVEFSTGAVANPQFETNGLSLFERRPLSIEQIMCERYFRLVTAHAGGYAASAGDKVQVPVHWPAMRTTPTSAVVTAGTATNVASSALEAIDARGARFAVTATATGQVAALGRVYSLSAEL